MKLNKFYIVIIIILTIIILIQKCIGDNKPSLIPKVIKTTDTTYVVTTKEVPLYIPKWKTKVKYIHDTTKIIDTVHVLNDYYSTYFYQDSLSSDSLHLYINDSVTQNKIKNRKIKYTLIYPIITTTNTVIEEEKNEFYTGVGLVGNSNGIKYIGPELLLKTKKKNIYGIGVGVDKDFQPNISIRMLWKINKS
jgi:hypothetical protein